MSRAASLAIGVGILAISAAGCTSRGPSANVDQPPALPVPFIAQRDNYCGPAALAMVANYHGHAVTQDAIAQSIYLPEIRGTLTADLADVARRFGLWVRQYRGSEPDLAAKLAASVPLIVLGKIDGQHHYFIVLRDGDPLIVHTDRRSGHRLPRAAFLKSWEQTGYWTLLACPPEKARWAVTAEEANDLGLHFERANDPCMAEQHYRQAAALDPANAYYHLNLGNAQLKQSLLPAAVASLERAVALAPQNADALNNLAWAYHQQGEQLEAAERLCRRAIELNPAKRAYYLDTLGSVQLKRGARPAAIATFKHALQATTDHQAALRSSIRDHLAAATAEPGP